MSNADKQNPASKVQKYTKGGAKPLTPAQDKRIKKQDNKGKGGK